TRPPGAGLEREWVRGGVAAGRTRTVLCGERLRRGPAEDPCHGGADHSDANVVGWYASGVVRGPIQDRRPLSWLRCDPQRPTVSDGTRSATAANPCDTDGTRPALGRGGEAP